MGKYLIIETTKQTGRKGKAMVVYVISITVIHTGFQTVMSTGYKSLEAAQAYLESREDKPSTQSGEVYTSDKYLYVIRDITIE